MIDFHSHIIPNIDDGSRGIEETFNLIKEAKQAGFEAIISTSHYLEQYYETNEAERQVWIQGINEKLEEENKAITLFLGNEIYLSENMISLVKEKKASTINHTNYVLFEMPLHVKPMNLYDLIYEMLEHKLIPILAHPERYSFIQKDPQLIYDLIQKGVLMQSNYGSVLGMYGEKAQIIVKKMLENNMVHVLGSDVHRQQTIYPNVKQALLEIEQIIGKEQLEELTTTNAKLMLQNQKISIEDPTPIQLTLTEKMKLNLKK